MIFCCKITHFTAYTRVSIIPIPLFQAYKQHFCTLQTHFLNVLSSYLDKKLYFCSVKMMSWV